MSTLMVRTKDPKELLPLLHERLDSATDEELTAVHKMLVELEARRLADELGAEMDQAWASGQITKENIAAAILEHRKLHPYR